MLHSIPRKVFIIPVLFFLLRASAQEISPYSRFGLGDIESTNFTTSKGMGGIAAGYRNPLHINFTNPASYSVIAFTTLETGVNFTTKNIVDKQQTYKTNDAFIDYLSLAFPVSKSVGGSIGLVPYSKMSYDFKQTKTDAQIGDYSKLYQGSGRLYQIYAGAAYRYPNHDTLNTFSIGVNASYVFGKLREREYTVLDDIVGLNIRNTSTTKVGDVGITAGVQYRKQLPKKLSLIFGAYSFTPISVDNSYDELIETYVSSSPSSLDTVATFPEKNNDITVPVNFGFGLTVDKVEKLTAGVDFSYTFWSKFQDLNDGIALHDSWRISIGGEYRPDTRLQSSFIKRIHYRLGAYYDNGFLKLKNANISEYGISFGFGIPIKSVFSRMNFSFEAGSRGTRTDDLIKENFFRAYIGFTLNDRWFIKRKYD